jgi:hypothetical protein
MSAQLHTTTSALPTQVKPDLDEWTREVLPRLPKDASEQARKLKAFERSREIGSATDLLRGLLAYVYTVHSFAHLSMWSLLVGVGDVSANDWRKRLRKASDWLSWLLQETLASSTPPSEWLLTKGLRRILLVDGTHFKCFGPKGMVWRIHTAFNLLSGKMSQVRVTDHHVGEHLEVFDLQAGDLVVTDRANGLRQRIAFVVKQQAQIVVRFSPRHLPLEELSGKAITVVKWLKGCHAPAGRIVSRTVWIRHQGQQIALRCIGLRLSGEQRDAAQRRKKRKASKNQQRVQAETLYLAGWILVVTTLPQEQWSPQEILRLYQARWHIELVFKRIKQLLTLHTLRCTTAQTALPTITALLLGWVLQEEEGAHLRLAMHDAMSIDWQQQEGKVLPLEMTKAAWWQNDLGPLSEWMVAEICVDLLCQEIRGTYTAQRYRICLPRLQRFLCTGHRKRPHLYSLVCRWLGMAPSTVPSGKKQAVIS